MNTTQKSNTAQNRTWKVMMMKIEIEIGYEKGLKIEIENWRSSWPWKLKLNIDMFLLPSYFPYFYFNSWWCWWWWKKRVKYVSCCYKSNWSEKENRTNSSSPWENSMEVLIVLVKRGDKHMQYNRRFVTDRVRLVEVFLISLLKCYFFILFNSWIVDLTTWLFDSCYFQKCGPI